MRTLGMLFLSCVISAVGSAQTFAPFWIPVTTNTYSDDFSGGSINGKWVEYDPQGDVSPSVAGGLLSVVVPAGTDHDWYTGINNAFRLRQTYTGSTNFWIEVKFTTTMTAAYQWCGLTVDTDNDNGIRYDANFDGSHWAHCATFSGGTYTNQFMNALGFSTQPYYLRIEKSGTTYTMKTSSDGASWSTQGSFTWAGAVNHIGIIVGTASGGTAPAFTATVDSFTYTAQ